MKITFRSRVRTPPHGYDRFTVYNTYILQVLIDQDHNEFYYYDNYTNIGKHLLLSEWEVFDIVT